MTIKIQEGTCVLKEEIHSEQMYDNVVKVFEDAGYTKSWCTEGFSSLSFKSHIAVGIYQGKIMNLSKNTSFYTVKYSDLVKGASFEQTSFTEELHQFCENHSLFYSFHINSGFTIDVEELSYTVKTSEDWTKFKTMYAYHEELLEKL